MLGKIDNRIFPEQQGFSRFDHDYPQICVRGGANCFDTDYRHIKAHVLIWFGNLDHDCAFARKVSTAFYRFIRALECFDRDDCSVLYDHSLANVESCDFLRDLPAKIDIRFLANREFWAGDQASGRKKLFEKSGGWQKIDTNFRQLVSYRSENRFGIALFEFRQYQQRFPIRP